MPETKHMESGFTPEVPQVVGPGLPLSGSDIGLNEKGIVAMNISYFGTLLLW